MGYALHVVERIGSPFLIVHEQIVLIPEGGYNPVSNSFRKLIFLLQGECRHRVVGAARRDADVLLRAGDILVVPYYCEQQYVSLHPGTACRLQALRLAFDPHAVPPLPLTHRHTTARGEVETSLTAFVRHHFQDLRHLPNGQDTSIRETLGQLREEAQQRPPGYRLRVRGLCTSLVTLVARQVMEAAQRSLCPVEDRLDYHVSAVKDYLLGHLNQPLRLGQVAAHAQLSEEYLARLFKQVTGQTIFAYVRQMRLERAKTYLASSDKNVSEIAQLTGFGSLPVFSRNFKRAVGLSPIEYRRHVAGEVG
jgi:AraC-like DNA-binding protein